MPDPLPRWLLALTGIVALVAIYVGIKDYVQQKNIPSQTSTVTSAVVSSAPISWHKKTSSAKTKQPRESATEVNASAKESGVASDTDKPLVDPEFTKGGANEALLLGHASKTVRDQATDDEVEASIDGTYRGRNRLNTIAMPGSSGCLPLPNLTKPGDVDAPYYENWAKAYCGIERP